MSKYGIAQTIITGLITLCALTCYVFINTYYLFAIIGSTGFAAFLLCFWFFRDPQRKIQAAIGKIYSPCDGTVKNIEKIKLNAQTNELYWKISVYLSLWNVHVNRIPYSGRVFIKMKKSGKYYPAFQSRVSDDNKHVLLGINTSVGKIYVKQIAGFLARQIVCIPQIQEEVRTGEKFGIIKMGSCVETFIPHSLILNVKKGDKVKAGITVLGDTGK